MTDDRQPAGRVIPPEERRPDEDLEAWRKRCAHTCPALRMPRRRRPGRVRGLRCGEGSAMNETPKYAAGTKVPIDRSKVELDGLLAKHGSMQRVLMHDEEERRAVVGFSLAGRKYRIEVPMPEAVTAEAYPKDPKVKGGYLPRPRGFAAWAVERRQRWAQEAYQQACRERWRGLVLLVKAKLEIVRMGASTFEREFLADLVLPSGMTAAETIGPYMQRLIAEGYNGPLSLPPASTGATS